jgi:hypothetical protein
MCPQITQMKNNHPDISTRIGINCTHEGHEKDIVKVLLCKNLTICFQMNMHKKARR